MLEGLRTTGAEELYRNGTAVTIDGREVGRLVMNHPPFSLHLLQVWGALAGWTGLTLGFWMRFTCAVADAVVVWLVWRMPSRAREEWAAVLLVALAPAAILVSGFHGNTDPIMIAFVVAAVYLLESGAPAAVAGAAFGVACSVQVWPLVLVPALLLSMRPWRAKAAFSASAAATAFVIGLPWIVPAAPQIISKVLGYSSMSGWWGLTYVLPVAYRPGVGTLMWAGVAAAQAWMHERVQSLYAQCAVVSALFLLLASGFGPQYLAWVVPFTAAAGWLCMLPFSIASACYLLGLYTAWSHGWLGFADANPYGIPLWVYRAGLLSWASLAVIIAGASFRNVRRDHIPRTSRVRGS
jgi:hypothetical protein